MKPQFLTPHLLSRRYGGWISPKTLANWRTKGEGPTFVKIGGRVMYRLRDVLEWEASRENQLTIDEAMDQDSQSRFKFES